MYWAHTKCSVQCWVLLVVAGALAIFLGYGDVIIVRKQNTTLTRLLPPINITYNKMHVFSMHSLGFNKCLSPCNHHHNYISFIPKDPLCSFAVNPPPPAPSHHFSTFCHYRLVLPIVEGHINGIIWCIASAVCILLLKIMSWESSMLLHISVAHSFFCWVEFHCMDVPQFVYSLTCW